MILVMQGTASIAAGTTTASVLVGQKYERPPANCRGTLYCTGSDSGLKAALNVDGLAVSDEVDVSDQNRIPIVPDDMLISDFEANAGGLMQLQVRNSDPSNNLDFFWRVELEVVG